MTNGIQNYSIDGKFDPNLKLWRVITPLSISTTAEEFLGQLKADLYDSANGYLLVPIYNDVSNKWRIEFRDSLMLHCSKVISLPASGTMDDLKILPIHNSESKINWLSYFANSGVIICVKEDWKMVELDCGLPSAGTGNLSKKISVLSNKYANWRFNSLRKYALRLPLICKNPATSEVWDFWKDIEISKIEAFYQSFVLRVWIRFSALLITFFSILIPNHVVIPFLFCL